MNISKSEQGFYEPSFPGMISGAFVHLMLWLLFAMPVMAQSLRVTEFHLENGIKVLLSPRPGSGAIHAAWFIEGGRGDTGHLPQEAADLLHATFFLDPSIHGVSGFWTRVGVKGIGHGRDIQAEGLESWCVAELGRLGQVIDQDQIEGGAALLVSIWRNPDPMSQLFSVALEGSRYEVSGRKDINCLSSVSTMDIQALAKKYVTARRITIIFVGDLDEPDARKALENNFGRLAPLTISPLSAEILQSDAISPAMPEIPQIEVSSDAMAEANQTDGFSAPQPEKHLIEISSETKSEVLIGWQVIPILAKNQDMLNLFAEILAGSNESRLIGHLVTDLGFSNEVKIYSGIPDNGGASLFVIQADVADGYSVHDVESAIQNEIARSVRDNLGFVEINRAIYRMDTKKAHRLADASCLAEALADAIGSTGGWRQAIRQTSQDAWLEAEQLKQFLQSIFLDGSSYSILAERDPILRPLSHDHARLVSLLKRLHKKRGIDSTLQEETIRAALRQFGQMPKDRRAEMLSLLESEVGR